jgi:hypothetical protein
MKGRVMRRILIIYLLVHVVLFCVFVYAALPTSNKYACTVLSRIPLADGNTIEIVNDTCQNGLPHTTDNRTIRMTRDACADSSVESTLKHERIHLAQKTDLEAWRRFYRDSWGYEIQRHPPPDLPHKYVTDMRPNPDTADAPYAIWADRYIFLPTYAGTERALRGARVVIYDRVLKRDLKTPPPEWKALFCLEGKCPFQYEHPHELAAELWTDDSTSPAGLILREWSNGLSRPGVPKILG